MDWSYRLLVDYCVVFISCLKSHSHGTHSMQRCFAKFLQICPDEETNFSTFWTAWKWANFHFGWTIPLKAIIHIIHSWCYLKRNICEQWLLLPAAPLSCPCRRGGCFLRPWWWEGSETVVRTGGKAVGPPRWWSPAPLRDHRDKWAGTSHGNTRPAQTSDTKVKSSCRN